VGGDIFHGALDLRQIFSARPMFGYADYRGPIQGLYLCGSGGHPGGASQGRRAIMLLATSCVISGAGASPERDSENGN
jgi:phytoene dehydrogenase-like protein